MSLKRSRYASFRGDNQHTVDCTGGVVSGDVVVFPRTLFKPDYQPHLSGIQTPYHACGKEFISGKVVSETKGGPKQQMFTIKQDDGAVVKVTSRTMYRVAVYRQPWADEVLRAAVLHEKYVEGCRSIRHGALKRLF